MPQPTPYLIFPGTCAEAIRFYETAIGGKIEVLMTIGNSPAAPHCPAEDADRIMHARLGLPGGGLLMAGDCPSTMPFPARQTAHVALSYDTVAEAEKVFAALSVGSEVEMPMAPSFWAKAFGMCTDRFGIGWMVNGELLPLPKVS